MRVAAVLLFACGVFAQDTPVFKSDVSLVHVDAEVSGPDGRILSGFSKVDFRVFDEGKEQPILHFSAGEEALDLILLFDVSGSMRPKVQEVAAAAREGVQELRRGDRVAVMVFNTRTRLLLPFTNDLDAVQRSIQQDVLGLRFGGGTYIQSAVSATAREFMRQRRTERRRAVLVITDNYGQRTRKESTVVRELWEADALLTGLIVRSKSAQTAMTIGTIMHPYMMGLQAGVKGIAEKTGGDFIHAGDAGADFQESMRRIRSRYSIYYAMPEAKPQSRRILHVELSAEAAKRYPKARVRARTGYITPGKTN
jgi:VWFA-related protein